MVIRFALRSTATMALVFLGLQAFGQAAPSFRIGNQTVELKWPKPAKTSEQREVFLLGGRRYVVEDGIVKPFTGDFWQQAEERYGAAQSNAARVPWKVKLITVRQVDVVGARIGDPLWRSGRFEPEDQTVILQAAALFKGLAEGASGGSIEVQFDVTFDDNPQRLRLIRGVPIGPTVADAFRPQRNIAKFDTDDPTAMGPYGTTLVIQPIDEPSGNSRFAISGAYRRSSDPVASLAAEMFYDWQLQLESQSAFLGFDPNFSPTTTPSRFPHFLTAADASALAGAIEPDQPAWEDRNQQPEQKPEFAWTSPRSLPIVLGLPEGAVLVEPYLLSAWHRSTAGKDFRVLGRAANGCDIVVMPTSPISDPKAWLLNLGAVASSESAEIAPSLTEAQPSGDSLKAAEAWERSNPTDALAQLDSNDLLMRAVALRALGPGQDPATVGKRVIELAKSGDFLVAEEAMLLLARQNAEWAWKAIAERCEKGPFETHRMLAARAIMGWNSGEAVQVLSLYLASRNTGSRIAAVRSLGAIDTPTARLTLLIFISDPDPVVRAECMRLLPGKEDLELRRILFSAVNDPSEIVRIEALKKLLSGERASDRQEAESALRGDSWWVKLELIDWAAGQQPARPGFRRIPLLLLLDPSPGVRSAAVRSLAAFEAPVTSEELGPILADTDPRVILALATLRREKQMP